MPRLSRRGSVPAVLVRQCRGPNLSGARDQTAKSTSTRSRLFSSRLRPRCVCVSRAALHGGVENDRRGDLSRLRRRRRCGSGMRVLGLKARVQCGPARGFELGDHGAVPSHRHRPGASPTRLELGATADRAANPHGLHPPLFQAAGRNGRHPNHRPLPDLVPTSVPTFPWRRETPGYASKRSTYRNQ